MSDAARRVRIQKRTEQDPSPHPPESPASHTRSIRKRTTRESKLAFSRGKRVQKREDADAKRAKRKKRTARQLRGIAGDARRHKKSKAEGQKRSGQQKKKSKQ